MKHKIFSTDRLPPQLEISDNHLDPKYMFGCDPSENCGICQICFERKVLGTTNCGSKNEEGMISLPNKNLIEEIWKRLLNLRYDDYALNEANSTSISKATISKATTSSLKRAHNNTESHKVVKKPTTKRAPQKDPVRASTVKETANKPGSVHAAAIPPDNSSTEPLRCSGRVGGVSWGCGERFSAMDGLKAHWASPEGTPCLEQFVKLRRGKN